MTMYCNFDFNLCASFLRTTLNGIGKEALMWAPTAIGLATNNPTILTASEVGYAIFHLYSAYKSENRTDRLTAFSNAAISLVSPFTYHPALASQISASTRAHVLMGVGGNNILRGASEIASATKDLACEAYAKVCGEKAAPENGRILGNSLRLGLGVLRVYSGTNQIQGGLSELSMQQPEPKTDSFQPSPKMDTDHARYEFKRNSKPQNTPREPSPKVNPKYAKEVFSHRPKLKTQAKNLCFPKSGTHHNYDIAFYKRASDRVKTPLIATEGRCEGTLYLRSEDTNYLHGKDNYLRAEDTSPIGEVDSKVVDALIQDGRVWYRTVEKVRDICKEIDNIHESGGKIKRLILVGHSGPQKMTLSQKGATQFDLFLDFPFGSGMRRSSKLDSYSLETTVEFPKKGCLNHLEPGADILLIGCSAGNGRQGSNLADAVAHQAPGHRVAAPLFETTMSSVDVRERNGRPELYFKEKDLRIDATYIAKVPKSKK